MLNWYDIVVVGALFYGVWSGIRAGLMGEIIRVIGLVLMIVLAVQFHQPVGDWIGENSSLPHAAAQLIAFVSIAVVVYLITLWVRLATRKRMLEVKTAALVENVGGGFAGAVTTGARRSVGGSTFMRATGACRRGGTATGSRRTCTRPPSPPSARPG